MKLGIVIPLKSATISKNWQVTCSALERTLKSIRNQSRDNFQVIVVGHECPELLQTSREPRIRFCAVDFPPPDRHAEDFTHQKLIRDKNMKIVTGIQALSSEWVDYWYQLDSDDVLHRNFIHEVEKIDGKAGAVIEGGYLVFAERNRAIASNRMSLYCGSTSILSARLIHVPEQIDEHSIKQIPWARIPHTRMSEFFRDEVGEDFAVIQAPVLGYVLGSGDNISDRWRSGLLSSLKEYLRPLLKGRKMDKAFRAAFALD